MVRNRVLGYIFGILFSAALVSGYQLENYDHLTLTSVSGILVFIGLSIVIGTLAPFGWKFLDSRLYIKDDVKKTSKSGNYVLRRF